MLSFVVFLIQVGVDLDFESDLLSRHLIQAVQVNSISIKKFLGGLFVNPNETVFGSVSILFSFAVKMHPTGTAW